MQISSKLFDIVTTSQIDVRVGQRLDPEEKVRTEEGELCNVFHKDQT